MSQADRVDGELNGIALAEARYRALFEQVHDAIYITSRDGTFLDVNRSTLDLFGYSREEILELKATDFYLDEEDRVRFQNTVEDVNSLRDFEVRLRHRDGSVIHALITSSVRLDDEGNVLGYHGIIHDITRRKEAEKALRVSEERYALAVRGANDGIWDWDILNEWVYVSPRWCAMLGLPEADATIAPDEWAERIHPDDRAALLIQIQAHRQEHRQDAAPHLEEEYRIRHEDGHYLWVLARGITLRDSGGTAYRMAGSLTDITARKFDEERLLYSAFHDTLTGLPNRALFMDRLSRVVERARRESTDLFAVLFLDLDRFKLVNDRLGHLVGDQLLIEIARQLERSVRPGDTVARLGGDEFAILLDGIRDLSDATRVADRILHRFDSPFTVDDHQVTTSGSIGIAINFEGYERPEDVLREADIALYKAKALGRGRHQVFDLAIHAQAVARLEFEAEIRRLSERSGLKLAFQPIIDLEKGTIVGFEALTRWEHPTQGVLLPAEFVPTAEEFGLVSKIGDWVIREAISQLSEWRAAFPERMIDVHVNFSGKQFAQHDLVSKIEEILEANQVPPERLTIELTERTIMENADTAIDACRRLEALGVRVCIDDFGTGYSSLRYLHRFPTVALKIDRTFIDGICTDQHDLEIVNTIIELARNLGIDTIAEGIETAEQLARVRDLGCKIGQGFLFAGALSPEDATELLRSETPFTTLR